MSPISLFKNILPRLALLGVGLLSAPLEAAPVDAAHPVTSFLRRLEEKGLVDPAFLSTLPRDEREIAHALAQAYADAATLTSWDRRRLERYLEEFDPTRKRMNTRLYYADSVATLRGRFTSANFGYLQDSLPVRDGAYFGSLIPGIDGSYGDNLFFSAEAFLGRENSTQPRSLENYNPQRGLPYGTSRDGKPGIGIPQKTSTFDGFRTVIGYNDGRLALEAGQDWNQWGPGRWQHTTLGTTPYFWSSDSLAPDTGSGFNGTGSTFQSARRGYRYPGESAPLPQVRVRLRGANWEYVKIVADRTGLESDSSAWLIAHRAQLRLGDFKFGVTEILTVGARSPDFITMLPGVPLKFAEHSGGDLDNSSVAADLEWTISGHGRLYAELFIDDYSGPPMNFRGNKFAVVLGGSWQDPLGLPATVHAEYAHVDPWTYGHHRYNTAMHHFGALLGSSLPPNSRSITAAADFPLPFGLEGAAEWRIRQRDLKSRGSSIFHVFDPGPPTEPTEKSFLETDVETRQEAKASVVWWWRQHVMVKGGVGGLWVENWRGNAGISHITPTAFSEVHFKY
jgi:hypothetical protein